MEIFIFLVILALILVFVSVKQVQQGQVGLIETLGKYTKTVNSGLNSRSSDTSSCGYS